MRDLLRLCTAGNVDDGKSTLIGRLLVDAGAVYADHIRAVADASRHRGAGALDYSLFTDGLKAEREQGITIDVAYRYFSTPRRAFILADTPGHEQYTRNMATGASTADAAVLLVDARHGIRDQTRLHANIARRMGVSTFILAVNKMDLIGFDARVFTAIEAEFAALLPNVHRQAIPISARDGDNVASRSPRTPWYAGPHVLESLEACPVGEQQVEAFRLPVQLVVRAPDFRGYAGQIASGDVRPGDSVTIWPTGQTAQIARLVSEGGDLPVAHAPQSVTVTLAHDVDVGRGHVIAATPMTVTSRLSATVVWMDERGLDPARVYVMKVGARTVLAQADRRLALNDLADITLTVAQPIAVDRYADHRVTGSFILVDPASCFTAGAGMIVAADPTTDSSSRLVAADRLARTARGAASDEAAIEEIRKILEDIL